MTRRNPLMLIALVLFLAAGPALADDDDFVGTYFAFVDQGSAAQTFKIEAGGTSDIIFDVGPTLLAGSSFTDDHGAWKQTGPREITIRSISFDYFSSSDVPPAGEVIGSAITTFVITFDDDFDEISGSQSGAVYARGVNPLRPGDEDPLFTFGGTFAGERITVDSGSDSDTDSDSD